MELKASLYDLNSEVFGFSKHASWSRILEIVARGGDEKVSGAVGRAR